MAHGFLSPQDVTGDNFWKNAKSVYDGLKWLRKQFKKDLRVVNSNVKEVRDLIEGKDQKALPPAAIKMFEGSNLKGLLSGATPTAITPKKAGIVNTQAKTDIVGRNATDLNRKEGKYLGTTDPDVAGGPKTSKGNYVNMPGISSPGGGLNPDGFLNPITGDVDIEGLLKSKETTDYMKMLVKKGRQIKRDQGISPTGEGAPSITPDSGVDIVAAVNKNTEAIVALSNLTKEQTKSQQSMHNEQQAQSDKLASRALARAEEKALEKGSDFSGFTTPEKFQKLLPSGQSGGGGAGGGFGLGIGGKVGARKIVEAVGKRGAARVGTRIAAKYGGKAAAKAAGKYGTKAAAKFGVKGAAKLGAGAVAKSAAKKIPLIGLGLGAVFAAQRALQGDFVGAGLELASGAASTVPGVGTVGSVGIDAALAARDMGMTPFAKGGIITQPTNALMGEAGKEGVFPLEGTRGKKTFQMFGEGVLNAQKSAEDDFAKIQAAGLKYYFQNQDGFKFFGDILKNVFSPFFAPLKAIGTIKNFGGSLLNSLLGNRANAASNPNSPLGGSGGGMTDPTISGDEEEYLMRLMIAEAGGEGELGMAAVGRSVLNRAGLIQSGEVSAGTFMANSGSITDVIEGSGQYQPFAEGKLKRELTPEERTRAKKALEMARNQTMLRGNLRASGMDSANVNNIMASTGFRTHAARYDASQEVNVTELGGHRFNTAGNAKMLTPSANVGAGISSKEGTGMATFGETDGGSGRLVNAAGYVHGHFQSNTGTAQDVVNDTSAMVRGMLNTGLTDISISDGTTFLPSMSDSEIKALVERGLAQHSHSGDGRSVDIFVPKGTPVPFPLTDVRTSGGGEGRSGILPGSGHTWVGHLTPDSQSGSKPSTGIAAEPNSGGGGGSQVASTPGSPLASNPLTAEQKSKMFQKAGMPAMSANTLTNPGPISAAPASPQTGTPIMATSAQVASASMHGAGPTVVNNYYTGGMDNNQPAGVNPNGVTAGISMDGSGLSVFHDLKIRSLG